MILVAGGSGTLGTRLPTLDRSRAGRSGPVPNPGKTLPLVGDYLEPVDEGGEDIDAAIRQAVTGASSGPVGRNGSA
jgi:hypothetical protein